jgi:hypothetical protein
LLETLLNFYQPAWRYQKAVKLRPRCVTLAAALLSASDLMNDLLRAHYLAGSMT